MEMMPLMFTKACIEADEVVQKYEFVEILLMVVGT